MSKKYQDKPLQEEIFSLPTFFKAVDSALNVEISMQYLKLMLYHRSQIPTPVESLLRLRSSENNTPAQSRYNKRCDELIESLRICKNTLIMASTLCKDFEVAIGFGATLSSLKDIFTLQFTSHGSNLRIPAGLRVVEMVSRKLGLSLAQSFDWTDTYSLTRAFVLVKIRKPDRDIGVLPWVNFKIPKENHKARINVVYDHEKKLSRAELKLEEEFQRISNEEEIKGKENVRIIEREVDAIIDDIFRSHAVEQLNEQFPALAIEQTEAGEKSEEPSSVQVVPGRKLVVEESSKKLKQSDAEERSVEPPVQMKAKAAQVTVYASSHSSHKPRWGMDMSFDTESDTEPEQQQLWYHIPVNIKGFKF